MFDTTTEAIEEDLKQAETAGVSRGQIALVRAQIRATLAVLNSPITTELTTSPAAIYQDWQDRIVAAAQILGWNPDELAAVITRYDNNPEPQDDITAVQLDDADRLDPLPVLVDGDDDPDADFDVFAEARAARKRKS